MLVETLIVIREEADSGGASSQRLKFILFGPKTESFATICRQAMAAENPAIHIHVIPHYPNPWPITFRRPRRFLHVLLQ